MDLRTLPLVHNLTHYNSLKNINILDKLIYIIKEELSNLPNHRQINYNNDKQVLLEELMSLHNGFFSRIFHSHNHINLHIAVFNSNVV